MSNGHDFAAYKKQFRDYLNALRTIDPKVRIAVATALPRAQTNATLKTEKVRQAWNDDLRAHFADMKIDRLLDIGLGTERVDVNGIVTPEPQKGGTAMGNWRIARASLDHERQPAATLTLSDKAGDTLTATAPPGTFTSDDVYRLIVTANGSAQITSVNPDGAEIGLSTLGHIPTKGHGEGDDQWKRNSILRSPFAKTTLAASEWTIRNDTSYFERGNDPTYPGGRILGDSVAPTVQHIIEAPEGNPDTAPPGME